MDKSDRVVVEFTRQEALVLWEFLRRCDEEEIAFPFADPAEERMVWELEIRIQPQLNATILDNANYGEDLAQARDAVRNAFLD
jgi:hypothetical protein